MKKERSSFRKLVLHRETLRTLQADQLQAVAGADTLQLSCNPDSFRACDKTTALGCQSYYATDCGC